MTDIYSSIPSFKKIIPKVFAEGSVIAVVGDITDPSSNTNKIVAELQSHNMQSIGTDPSTDLTTLQPTPNVCCVTTPSDQTLGAVQKCQTANINLVWIEIGSENTEAINFCKENNMEVVYFKSIVKELIAPTEKELEKIGKTIS